MNLTFLLNLFMSYKALIFFYPNLLMISSSNKESKTYTKMYTHREISKVTIISGPNSKSTKRKKKSYSIYMCVFKQAGEE